MAGSEAGRPSRLTYEEAGVAAVGESQGFRRLLAHLRETFALRPGTGRPLLGFGHYASVIDIGLPVAVAFSTDGVGTKAIIAQMLDRYDTIGIDCVAMNANDVVCVGAEPLAMTDYIAVARADDRLLDEIGRGLAEGARRAGITIPGGEISQIGEIINSYRPGFGFDLLGTCIGVVERGRVVTGAGIEPGDVIVGLASSGVHSNGLTLAREALFKSGAFRPEDYVAELGRTVGEELLEPTRIYVRPVLQMLGEGLAVKALAHITGDGLLNLSRVDAPAGFVIERLPEPPPVFRLIARQGVAEAEMFRVFNMGVGFCVVVAEAGAGRVVEIARENGIDAWPLGTCVHDEERRVRLVPAGLVGAGGRFTPE